MKQKNNPCEFNPVYDATNNRWISTCEGAPVRRPAGMWDLCEVHAKQCGFTQRQWLEGELRMGANRRWPFKFAEICMVCVHFERMKCEIHNWLYVIDPLGHCNGWKPRAGYFFSCLWATIKRGAKKLFEKKKEITPEEAMAMMSGVTDIKEVSECKLKQ